MRKPANYTPEVIKFLEENYPEKGAKFCAENLGSDFTAPNILAFCARKKIKRIDPYEGPRINLNDFVYVTDPRIAYLLGFYWADGHLVKKGIVSRNVKDDADLIYEMVKGVGKVISQDFDSICGWRPTRSICIFNMHLADYLRTLDYGDKSNVSPWKVLETIKKDVQRFFWLGFLDGDGCFCDKGRNPYLSFTGTFDQNWSSLSEFLTEMNCGFFIHRHQGKDNKFSTLKISSPYDIAHLGAFLYKSYLEDGLGLPRKYEKYLKIKKNGIRFDKNKLGLKGVQKNRLVRSVSYYVLVTINEQTLYKNGFSSAEEAAVYHDKVCVQYLGHKAKTNFPIENYMDLGVPNYEKPIFFDSSELTWRPSAHSLKRDSLV